MRGHSVADADIEHPIEAEGELPSEMVVGVMNRLVNAKQFLPTSESHAHPARAR